MNKTFADEAIEKLNTENQKRICKLELENMDLKQRLRKCDDEKRSAVKAHNQQINRTNLLSFQIDLYEGVCSEDLNKKIKEKLKKYIEEDLNEN